MNDELSKVRDWAQDKLDAEQDPSWVLQRYVHLVALIDGVLASQDARTRARQSPAHASTVRRRGNVIDLDSFRRRPRPALRLPS